MQKHEISILENYWSKIDEMEESLKLPSIKNNKVLHDNIKHTVNTLRQLYNEVEPDYKTIIDMRYLDDKEECEWADVADELYVSVFRVLRKRNKLMKITAERLGFILI